MKGRIFAKKIINSKTGRSVICVRLRDGSTRCVVVLEGTLPKGNRLRVGEELILGLTKVKVRGGLELETGSSPYVPEIKMVD
jgi:hypothetical protein